MNVGSEVNHEFGDGSMLILRGDATLYSLTYNDVANTPIIAQPSYVLANARLTYTLSNKALSFSVFGTNLSKSRYIVSGNASGPAGLAEASFGAPREWGISATASF